MPSMEGTFPIVPTPKRLETESTTLSDIVSPVSLETHLPCSSEASEVSKFITEGFALSNEQDSEEDTARTPVGLDGSGHLTPPQKSHASTAREYEANDVDCSSSLDTTSESPAPPVEPCPKPSIRNYRSDPSLGSQANQNSLPGMLQQRSQSKSSNASLEASTTSSNADPSPMNKPSIVTRARRPSLCSVGSLASVGSTPSRKVTLQQQIMANASMFSRHSGVDASARAEYFHIRVTVPTDEHLQLLRSKLKSSDGEDAQDHFLDKVWGQLPKWMCLQLQDYIPLATCEWVLTVLAVVAVVAAPFQLGVESMCERKWERSVMLAGKGLHLACSLMYACLALVAHASKGNIANEDQDESPSLQLESMSQQRTLQRRYLLDILTLGGLIAEIIHLGETPEEVPSWSQWCWLLHICKVWRVFATQNYVTNTSGESGFAAQVLALFGWLAFVAHVFACVMAGIATLEAYFGIQTWADAFLHVDQERSCSDFYISSLYFSTYTLTGTGYGDVVPLNTLERIPTITFMLFAQMYSAKIIANLNWITSMHNYWYTTYCEKKTQMQAALSSLNVPKCLRQRILAYQDFIEEAKKEWRVRGCINDLSTPLREELWLSTFHTLVTRAPFLQAQPIEVLRIIMSSLEDQVFLPCDVIMRRGDGGTDIYFMRSGKAGVFPCITMPSWDDAEAVELKAGSYFGELAYFTMSCRKAWIVARTYSVCSVLEKTVMDQIVAEHPGCFVSMIKSLQNSCKLTPVITWQEIALRVASNFRDLDELREFLCDDAGSDEELYASWSRFESLMKKVKATSLDQKLRWAELDHDCVGLVNFETLIKFIGTNIPEGPDDHSSSRHPSKDSSSQPQDPSFEKPLGCPSFEPSEVRCDSPTSSEKKWLVRTNANPQPPDPPCSKHQDLSHQMQSLMHSMTALTQRVDQSMTALTQLVDQLHEGQQDLTQHVKTLSQSILVVPH